MRTAPTALMPAGAVLIYAAGFGTRMGALTADRPKPLIPVAGRALLDHALALVPPGLRTVANTHYRADQIAAHVAGRGVLLSHEPELLETGGGLRAALPLLDADPVYTLNSDAVWTGPNPLETLADAWDATRMDALLLVLPKARAAGHKGPGDFAMAADGALTRGPGIVPAVVHSGAQIISPSLLASVPDRIFSSNKLWNVAASRGRLFGVLHPGGWCDVGQPESIPLAEAMLATADV